MPARVVAVSLDGKPLATSHKILLQVMSEERATGFETQPVGNGVQKIVHIGREPWSIKSIGGVVKFKRVDAGSLKVIALDANGDKAEDAGFAAEIKLRPGTIYYLIGG